MTRLEAYAATARAMCALALARMMESTGRWCFRRASAVRSRVQELRRDLEAIARR
jgi:hypothetical protein